MNDVRDRAKKDGIKIYRSGSPCNKGHPDPLRYVSNNRCIACWEIRRPGNPWFYSEARARAAAAGDATYVAEGYCKWLHDDRLRYVDNNKCVRCTK